MQTSHYAKPGDTVKQEIDRALDEAPAIRFQLNGVNLNRVNSNSGKAVEGQIRNGYTDYELYNIKKNPALREKTTFYRGDTKVNKAEILKKINID